MREVGRDQRRRRRPRKIALRWKGKRRDEAGLKARRTGRKTTGRR